MEKAINRITLELRADPNNVMARQALTDTYMTKWRFIRDLDKKEKTKGELK